MLGWAEVCMHFFDFFHVVFVACCCNPCEAFKMLISEAVSLFPLYSVHGWECWLASVCAHKEGHHFLHKWLQSGKIFFRHQTPEVTNTCSEFNFENVFCLQFYHFTFYSCTLCRAEQSDSWSERWHYCDRICECFGRAEGGIWIQIQGCEWAQGDFRLHWKPLPHRLFYFSVLIPVTPDGWCSGNW